MDMTTRRRRSGRGATRSRLLANAALPALTLGMAVGGASVAEAASIIMEGNFVRTAISDDGTLGFGGTTSPGILHDPTGTGDFSANHDYLTPGDPYENFAVRSDQTGLRNNGNSLSDAIAQISITDLSGLLFDNHVNWVGQLAGFFEIEHDYFFNDNQERINIETTITALTDLTNVTFGRSIDPDPDHINFGSFSTINSRGLDLNNDGDFDDPGEVPPESFVGSVGPNSGQTIGLFSTSSVTHNTGIHNTWSFDPLAYLAGGNQGNSSVGDHSIGIGFDIGSLLSGESITLTYAYVMGGTLETVDLGDDPDPTSVPEPGTLGLLGAGLAGAAFWRVRRRRD